MVKIESKEKLAKLLAVEDLDIQHQQVKTAMFDVKNRCLILPIWKDIPDYLYDLFVGHEVGHALFTPTNPERLKKIIKKTSKDCVNVIEDVRIEILVRRRYPGLKKQFFKGYNNLLERDFFGLKDRDINESGFLDRLNIFFKVPQYGTGIFKIAFNKEEQKIVEKIQKVKSFKDVEALAVQVHSYVKANEKNNEDSDEEGQNQSDNDDGDNVDGTGENGIFDSNSESGEGLDEESKTSGVESDEESKESKESKEFKESKESGEKSDEKSESKESEEKSDSKESNSNESEDVPDDPDEVVSKTQRYFDERVNSDLVDKSSKNVYVNFPEKVNLNNAVHDYKKVHNNINRFYNSLELHSYWKDHGMSQSYFEELKERIYSNAKTTLQKIKKDSIKNVNHIAMEFERKKAADVYKKTLVCKTGILDTNKLFSAKYNEDVFKKNTKIPEGKNHGLVMFIDWSGSMAIRLSDCIKQVIELTLFCKKVNIPFEVYSFTDRYERNDETRKEHPAFDYRHGDLVCDNFVKLRNYVSSRMSAKEYNNALINLCIFMNRYNKYGRSAYVCPPEDELGSTPLNGAIILSEHIIRNFKKKNNLESVHAVWLTDGEGNYSSCQWDAIKKKALTYYDYDINPNVYLKDKKTKKDYLIHSKEKMSRSYTTVLFDIVKDRLGINIIGFFLMDFRPDALWRYIPGKEGKFRNRDLRTYEKKQLDIRNWIKDVKKAGYFIKKESGYDEYYVLNTAESKKKPLDDIDGKMTTRKMVNIFSQKNQQFKAKRVILSKFVDLITSK